jgi:TolB-like protein
MSEGEAAEPRPAPTIFLSYASEDRQAARSIGDTLPGYGLEVWYDESELGGGDAWDQKIRRQIRECDYFMALISAHTEARHEGYFRREWRLAVERTLDMADDRLFLLPVVLDDTPEAGARVPEKFLSVQWLKVPGGRPTPALEALCRRIASGDALVPAPPRRPSARAAVAVSAAPAFSLPQFPKEEPGQRVRFWAEVLAWALRSLWALFLRLPRWLRILAILWLAVVVMSRGCTSRHHESAALSPAAEQKVRSIADQYQGGPNSAAAAAQLAQQIAGQVSAAADNPTQRHPLLVVPFVAPPSDAAAVKLANSSLGEVYGRLVISHHGKVAMVTELAPTCDLPNALAQGRSKRADFVVCAAIETQASAQVLTVRIAGMEDGAQLWTKSYPVASADPANIAKEVDSEVTALYDDD